MKHETANANTTEQYGYTESYLCRIRVTLSVRGNLLASRFSESTLNALFQIITQVDHILY
ncbi:MAG: hypothetical protein M1113_00400 [Candidatus Thermoplasmatota archaeon]|nr:hypothetical protein [Candidatus Thermoplasmatota archaeon]